MAIPAGFHFLNAKSICTFLSPDNRGPIRCIWTGLCWAPLFLELGLFVCCFSGCTTISWYCCDNQGWHKHTDHNPHWLETCDQRLPPLSLSPPISTLCMLLLSLPCLSLSFCTSQCLYVCMFILCSRFIYLCSYSDHLSSKNMPFGFSSPFICFNSYCWRRGVRSALQKLSSVRKKLYYSETHFLQYIWPHDV